MAVYDHGYKRYAGPLTPAARRFLVLPRFAWEEIFRSRLLTAFFTLACLVPVGFAVAIYLRHNLSALAFLEVRVDELVAIDARFFRFFLGLQTGFAFLFAAFVGPALIAPDLAHNALPLYLSRPFSRAEYVLGKLATLALLLSAVTWIPGLLLFAFQSYLAGGGWMAAHARFAGAMLLGGLLWVLLVSLLALAVSAWVRWRPVATALFFGVWMVGTGFGNAIVHIFDTRWGALLSLTDLFETVWAGLFGGEPWINAVADRPLPFGAAWAALLTVCGLCLLLLGRKIRAYEVVR